MTALGRWVIAAGLVGLLILAILTHRVSAAFVLGVVIFAGALLISIMLHETGHFLTAKRFGMQVTAFFVGFGSTLWSRRVGETEYGVKAVPLGGFVKITGMTTMDEVEASDEPRSFRRQPAWQRAIVLVAGSFMHFLLAFVLLFFLALGVGLENVNTATVGSIDKCVPASVYALDNGSCRDSLGISPARKAGLQANDKIISIAGTRVSNWNQIGKVIRAQPAGEPVRIVVQRHGRLVTLTARPSHVPGRAGSYIGIAPALIFQQRSPLSSVGYAGSSFGQIITESGSAVARLPAAIPDLFAKNRANTAAGQVSSVVGAADYAGQAVEAGGGWKVTVSILLLIIISLNIFVGAFNLLPLLPLDGGHLAIVVYERIRAWLARLRGRPDPGLVDIQSLLPVMTAVFVLLIGLAVLLVTADLFNPVHLA